MANNNEIKEVMELPLLASRGVIVFPHMVIPLLVGRDKSIAALEEAMMEEKKIIIAAQKDETVEEPEIDEIYQFGTIAEVKQLVKLPNGMIKVVVEGIERAEVIEYLDTEEYFLAEVESRPEEKVEVNTDIKALMRTVVKEFEEYIKYNRNLPAETIMSASNIEEPGRLADVISSQVELKYQQLQELLEATDIVERLEKMLSLLQDEIEVLKIEQDINKRVKKKVEKNQKEYYLREKMKVIQDELDEDKSLSDEIEEYYKKLEKAELPDNVAEKVEEEIEKLDRTPNMSPEATVIRNYLDCILDLPWNKVKEEEIDIKNSEEILEADHYGLKDVKERILEYLAVRKMAPAKKSPILCLVGAPGVGKTSLGRSIARALDRDFVRLSLGGVRDEAEIRGHRRTYIGSRPGRIINAMRDAGSKNPVFLLDEVDKMSSDFRGDPASAMLEVLDPEQNKEFGDHYLEVPFDLSQVLFVTTANVAHTIPAPLLDRMELIEIPGYTEDEKLKIAEGHLLPKIYEDHGLKDEQINISSNAILKVIREYTREAGVRNLERKLAAITRKVAKEFVEGRENKALVAVNSVEKYLGLADYEHQESDLEDRIGVATGLAYNQAGGDILDIEVAVVPGKGELTLTGSLGDVMKESAQAALSYVRSKQNDLNLSDGFYKKFDIHIHVPQGAVPKDGPSAGITIAIALASALTGRKVRGDYAMTGEISLRGRVLPIGGLKTKILAGRRAGINKFILPKKNENKFKEIEKEITRGLDVTFVSHMDQVMDILLLEDENHADY
ncbi:MAG: ATP-dependent Lon protease [Halanaerobium sp. 4-GBenrich]|jgi:ATP-dependent Lon protease|uniref:Lon protease n=1 Tax=Halanaerobium congolense TaxID=54121 RepID=A0A1G6QT34_9FIRM|nr:endopeptidase La [Halanaerobium congolense]KXS48899.1 MAG: ATP-dependent Lon protease [Halanaerobium sp. T82-1]ODS49962.1 MAG: ATP-dependent Lon protease [Halanaerobium sp. 4-GBenrich]OEG62602.1 MAG: endopeptidase La [Halanaerobium sp. MDAL1]PUU92982.1 MAG: ATP-dependent Lon protease [Halanaerobium sp.]PTX16748.1 ATP-dependent proteinase [Halanaerobium congolense]